MIDPVTACVVVWSVLYASTVNPSDCRNIDEISRAGAVKRKVTQITSDHQTQRVGAKAVIGSWFFIAYKVAQPGFKMLGARVHHPNSDISNMRHQVAQFDPTEKMRR